MQQRQWYKFTSEQKASDVKWWLYFYFIADENEDIKKKQAF